MTRLIQRLWREEDGATALEYAILVVLIAIVMSVGAAVFGGALSNLFSQAGTSVSNSGPGAIASPAVTAPSGG